MKINPYQNNRGFTLIELLVVIAIIGVLASIAMQAHSIYRTAAFRSRITASMNQLKIALEAGISNRSPEAGFLWTTTGEPGAPTVADAEDLVPGFVNTVDQTMHAWYNGWCDSGQGGGLCMVESASIWSCKSGYQTMFFRFKSGLEQNFSWQGQPWC